MLKEFFKLIEMVYTFIYLLFISDDILLVKRNSFIFTPMSIKSLD